MIQIYSLGFVCFTALKMAPSNRKATKTAASTPPESKFKNGGMKGNYNSKVSGLQI